MIINTGMRTELKYLDELDKYKQYWFVTITPYGKDIEPNVPDKEKVIESFKKLSNHIGANAIGWRDEQIEMAKAFSKIGKENDIVIHSCCEKTYRAEYGLEISGCMSKEIVEKAIGYSLNPPKVKNLREDCNCLMGNDIGAYNTCGHLCKYCYANYNKELVLENMRKHDENSPFLIGKVSKEDNITEAKQKSWKIVNEQISFL